MAIIENILTPVFTDIDPNSKTVSIGIQTQIIKDNIVISSSMLRCCFAPGEIDKVKAFIGLEESPEITYLNTIWDQAAIDAYNQSISGLTT